MFALPAPVMQAQVRAVESGILQAADDAVDWFARSDLRPLAFKSTKKFWHVYLLAPLSLAVFSFADCSNLISRLKWTKPSQRR